MKMLFFLVFFAVVGYILYAMLSKLAEWHRNNLAPEESVRAQLVKAEEKKSTSMMPVGADGAMMPVDSTSYELTFSMESGEEKQYKVSGKIYRKLVQGAVGTLRFKGTRFMAFDPE